MIVLRSNLQNDGTTRTETAMSVPKVATIAGFGSALIVVGLVLRMNAHTRDITWALFADLKNLAKAQAAYYEDHASFGGDLTGRYAPSHGALVQITHASDTTWSAVATFPRSERRATISYAQPRHASDAQVREARVAAMNGLVAQLGMNGDDPAR
jgi:hypothetical protein